MDSLQRRIRQELFEKIYLLILDWNENLEDWVKLKWRHISKVSTFSIALEMSSLTTILNYTYLRTLKLNGASVKELPSAIGKLKHLRHIDLSYSPISTLPSTFWHLCNLQILNLSKCEDLKSLPRNIRYMTNLRRMWVVESYAP
ncbi:hypothetical protein ACS0TY_018641 [Phlomoides rotata]